MNIPYDPVSHGGSRFSLVGPVLRFTLEKNPVFLYWTQAPTTGLGSVSSPPALKDKRERRSSLVQWSAHMLVLLRLTFLTTTYSGRDALLKRSPNGQAAVVEVADELRVNGATELSHLPLGWSNEDALNGLHENIVEQGVLCSWGQPVPEQQHRGSLRCHSLHQGYSIKSWRSNY